MGEHRGIPFYTVGQRSGLGLSPSRPDAAPVFVTAVDAATNTVRVGPRADLQRTEVRLAGVHWIDAAPAPGEQVSVQLRAHAAPAAATVTAADDHEVVLRFVAPASQVAPGQAGVVYDGDEVLGGGVVEAP